MHLTTSPVAEDHIQVYRQVLMTVHKKISDCLQGGGKGTDGQSIERRLKKTLEFSLGQSLSEQGRLLGKQSSTSCLGKVGVDIVFQAYLTKLCRSCKRPVERVLLWDRTWCSKRCQWSSWWCRSWTLSSRMTCTP